MRAEKDYLVEKAVNLNLNAALLRAQCFFDNQEKLLDNLA